MKNNLEIQYLQLLEDILENGHNKKDRTGTGTLSLFGKTIRHNMSEGFPLITTKKMYWKGIVTELLWFLRGDTNIKYLVDNNCHIWDGDAHKNWCKQFEVGVEFDAEELARGHSDQIMMNNKIIPYETASKSYNRGRINAYLEGKANKPEFYLTKEEFIELIKTDDEFAKKWGELGPVYGKQWRAWGGFDKMPAGWEHGTVTHYKDVPRFDQISESLRKLKEDPDSRRNKISAWNVGELDQMVLPPCHTDFQFYTRELSLEERINIALGWGYDSFDLDIAMGNSEDTLSDYSIPTRAISLLFNMRSNDVPLGLPFNLASYGLLLEIFAKKVNMVPEELIANLGDAHIYVNQIDGIKEQLKREPYTLPKLDIHPGILDYEMENYPIELFQINDYKYHPSIKMPLSN